MIQQVVTLIAAGAFAATLAAPALAQTPAPAAPAKPDAAKTEKMDKMDKAAKPAKAVTKTATGKVKKVTEGELVVIVTPKGKDAEDVTFIVEKETKIMKGGKVVAVKDVMEAETVTVTYAEMEGKKTAKSVTSKPAPAAAKK
jgi:uncharacterized protein YcgI (DUF1989 family)